MMVLPVRIIMSPTCSSRFLVGKNARSATARTTRMSSLLGRAAGGADCDQKAYGIRPAGANREPLGHGYAASERAYPVVSCGGFGEDGAAAGCRPASSRPDRPGGDRACRVREWSAPGRERAEGGLPRGGHFGELPLRPAPG